MNKFRDVEKSDQFWDANMQDPKDLARLHDNTGHAGHPQRVAFREFLRWHNIKSVLDCGAGPGWELGGLERDDIKVDYVGLEVTEIFAAALEQRGVTVIRAGVEQIPCEDRSFDMAYIRQVLEHVGSLEQAVSEMVRVARRYVYVSMNWDFGSNPTRKEPRRGLIRNFWSEADFRSALAATGRALEIVHRPDLKSWMIGLRK